MIENFNYGNYKSIIFSILLVLVNFCETWSIWLLILNFSVNHFATFNSISLFFNFADIFLITQPIIFIVCILGIVIIVFTLLIYNEIIILKFCDLDKNTAIEINRRALIDLDCSFEEDDDEICTKTNDNYVIMKEDIEGSNDESNESL